MDLRFELGEADSPSGHCILYFTSSTGDAVLATYVVCPPIELNLAKYVPPAFASLINPGQAEPAGVIPFPPVVEEVESVEWLRRQAAARRDDLVDAGVLYSLEVSNLVQMTAEAAGSYAVLYAGHRPVATEVKLPEHNGKYADLTEGEKLNEMTRLVGQLRDQLGVADSDSTRQELAGLAATLPSKYRGSELVDWATQPGDIGQRLATLHLQRSFKLLNEDYLEIAEIEEQIRELQAQLPTG